MEKWKMYLASVPLGAGILVSIWSIFGGFRRKFQKFGQERRGQNLNYDLDLNLLYGLTKSSNLQLRKSAEQMILERVTRDESLMTGLLKWSYCEKTAEQIKAVTVMSVLLKSADMRSQGMGYRLVKRLAELFVESVSTNEVSLSHEGALYRDSMQQLALCAIFDFIVESASCKEFLCQQNKDFVKCCLATLTTTNRKEVMRFALYTIHQIVLHEPLSSEVIDAGGISAMCACLHSNQGDPTLQRVSLQILVIFVTVTQQESKKTLRAICGGNIVRPVVMCLKSDDPECIYSSLALLHDFTVNDLCKDEICGVPGVLFCLTKILTNSEANVQRLVLRLLSFLALKNDVFQEQLVQQKDLMKHLSIYLASSDKEVVHWALVLIHDLAMSGKGMAEKVYKNSEKLIVSLVSLTQAPDSVIQRLLAETLGFFNSCETLAAGVVRDGVLKTVLHFSSGQDPELKFWGAAMLLNMTMTSDAVKCEILETGCLHVIMDLAISEHENSQISALAAKTLAMLQFTESPLCIEVEEEGSAVRVKFGRSTLTLPNSELEVLMWNCEVFAASFQGSYDNSQPIELSFSEHDVGNFVVLSGTKSAYQSLKGLFTSLPVELYECADTGRVIVLCKIAEDRTLAVIKSGAKIHAEFTWGNIVGDRVDRIVFVPLVNHILTTPPDSQISKITELELLEVLCRIERHRNILLHKLPVLNYLHEMLRIMDSDFVTSLECQPMRVTHCLAALRIIAVVTITDESRVQLLEEGILDTMATLLEKLNSLTLQALWPRITSTGESKILDEQSLATNEQPLATNYQSPATNEQSLATNETRPKEERSQESTSQDTAELFDQSKLEAKVHVSELAGQSLGANGQSIEANGQSIEANGQSIEANGQSLSINGQSLTTEESHFTEVSAISGYDESSYYGARSSTVVSRPESYSFTEDLNASVAIEKVSHSVLSDYEELLNQMKIFIIQTFASASVGREAVKICDLLWQNQAFYKVWSAVLSVDPTTKSAINLASVIMMCGVAESKESEDIATCNFLCSEALLMSRNNLALRNDHWTFESAWLDFGFNLQQHGSLLQQSEAVYYEVTLRSSGIVQLGWTNGKSRFSPERGLGVGDDCDSYAFDGARCKTWNGPITQHFDNDYGEQWEEADVITCMLSKTGEMYFLRNGRHQGVAFKGIDMSVTWYPAVSLSTGQHIEINLGTQPSKYLSKKDEYCSIYKLCCHNKQINNNTQDDLNEIAALPDISTKLEPTELGPLTLSPKSSSAALYFEVTPESLKVQKMAVQFGYSSMDESAKIVCSLTENVLMLPDGQRFKFTPQEAESLGCGLDVTSSSLFFTFNGRVIKGRFICPSDVCKPYTNTQLTMNFGARNFYYIPANDVTCRLQASSILNFSVLESKS